MLQFNLLTDSWINVLDQENITKLQSIEAILLNTKNYIDISPKMKITKVVIYRQILAILMTYYTKFDQNDNPYNYNLHELNLNDLDDYNYDLENTWLALKSAQSFTPGLFKYLNTWQSKFEMFSKKPYLSLTKENVESINHMSIDSNWGKPETVLLKYQSEYGDTLNKLGLSSTYSTENKKITIPEFIESYMTHLQYGETAAKAKITKVVSYGWLYSTSQIIIGGANLFEILINNLVLNFNTNQLKISPNGVILTGIIQNPMWEKDTITEILNDDGSIRPPEDVSDIYSRPTYMLAEINYNTDHITGVAFKKLPKWNNENFFIDPMVYYKENKRSKNENKPLVPVAHIEKTNQMFTNLDELGFLYMADTPLNGHITRFKPHNVSWALSHCQDVKTSLRAYYAVSDGNPTSYKVTELIETSITLPTKVLTTETFKFKIFEILTQVSNTIRSVTSILYKCLKTPFKLIDSNFKRIIENKFYEFISLENLNQSIYHLLKIWDIYEEQLLITLKTTMLSALKNRDLTNLTILKEITKLNTLIIKRRADYA